MVVENQSILVFYKFGKDSQFGKIRVEDQSIALNV